MKSATMFVLCLFFALAPISLPTQTGSAQADIIALEKSWNEAELRHDHVALARLMSDDLVLTEPDGSVINKAEEVAFTADPGAHFEVLESHDLKVQIHGNAAVVTCAYHEKGTFHGKPFEHRGRYTDTWGRHNGTWQCIAGHFSVPVPE
jgi:ketosteroid isomerase-like protein